MKRTKIIQAMLVGLFGLVAGGSAYASGFELRVPAIGARARPVSTPGGGAGAGSLPTTTPAASTKYLLLKSGTSYTIPAGVTSVVVWAVGAGGGGAGVDASDWVSGGGGAGGGVTWQSFQVRAGQAISYAIGAAGIGGVGANDGGAGGRTTVVVGNLTLVAYGGAGGSYNSDTAVSGGSWSGGFSGADGGLGGNATGDEGGGPGGGLGGANGDRPMWYGTGQPGARANYPGGLDVAVTAAGQALGEPGASPGEGSDSTINVTNGGSATGFGNGGASASWFGGNGGNGSFGGGGGGASGFSAEQKGGAGGPGAVVLKLN